MMNLVITTAEGKKIERSITTEQMGFIQRLLYSPKPFAMKLWDESDIQSAADMSIKRKLAEKEMSEVLNRLTYEVFEECYDFEWDEIINTIEDVTEVRE